MDEVVIGIGINENKKTWFPTEKRVEMIEKLFADDPRVKIDAYDCLTIDFASCSNTGDERNNCALQFISWQRETENCVKGGV